MTFFEKIQAHEGGLIRLDISEGRAKSFLSEKTGMVYSVSTFSPPISGPRDGVIVDLFIDGKIHTVFLYEEEIQFL